MTSNGQLRGALLEEAVAWLLESIGYRILRAGDVGVEAGAAGINVRGRGALHQIDTLAGFDATPAFMFPLRLLLEAKCYEKKVGLPIVRNSVGVVKDISENYFTLPGRSHNREIQIQRFNYHAAIFASNGYTRPAQEYAVAHQVFLIDYKGIRPIVPLIDALRNLSLTKIQLDDIESLGSIRRRFAAAIRGEAPDPECEADEYVPYAALSGHVSAIRGSYFGMLQGRWPVHLLSRHPLPPELFRDTDVVQCRVWGRISETWSFAPVDVPEGDPRFFRLDFRLPVVVGELIAEANGSPMRIADLKENLFSYLVLAGRIGGIQRIVRLVLDQNWIDDYRSRFHAGF
jgi:hypothetical protein